MSKKAERYKGYNREQGENEIPVDEEVVAEAKAEAEEVPEDNESAAESAEAEAADVEDKAEEEGLMSRLMRLQADFENYKKRTQKEKLEVYSYALEGFVTKLLPVLDNFERSEAAAEEGEENSNYRDGIKLVQKQLLEVLEAEGLKEIPADGETFDPNFHHGVAVGDEEGKADQEILETFQKGYTFKDKVIRPAMVKVNQS